MSRSTIAPSPHLQPPGSGLPRLELFVARFLVGRAAKRATRESSAALFASEHAAISERVRACDPETARRRVLIPRPRGMEDSSRYWSVFMTLDHLRIVNHSTANLIAQLARGETPARMVGTADVKPSPDVDESVVEGFEEACAHFEDCVAQVADLRTALRWPHPWFGPLDAANWHFFTAFHMQLHRRQIDAILAAAPASR